MNAPGPKRRSAPLRFIFCWLLATAMDGYAQRGSGERDGERGMGGDAPRPVQRLPIFFPPNPPPLDSPVSRAIAPSRNRLMPPEELAAYISDPFYAALSTRLFTRTLTDKLKAQLESYRVEKVALREELRAEVERLREAEPEARRQGFEALARKQSPRLVELEKKAEQLRQELIASGADWRAHRDWGLSQKTDRGFSPIEIAQVMRAYAFYEKGLLPGQRRLLREISIELMMAADNTSAATAAQPYIFFPPEPARVLLPDDLPADFYARVAAYQTQKSKLKKELYDAVSAQDGGTFNFLRSRLPALAQKQAGPLAELDKQAEEIRRGLAEQGVTVRPPERSPLPPTLTARLNTMLRDRETLQREATQEIEAIIARNRELPVQVSYSFEIDGLHYVVVPRRSRDPASAAQLARQVDTLRAEVAVIADRYGRQIVQFINEGDAIYRETSEILGSKSQSAIDAALLAARRVAAQKENEAAYREYRIAVFQPGLSPEQRRLLFDSAVQKLEIPLPRGELQPTRRASSW